jgi:hypothetical protein
MKPTRFLLLALALALPACASTPGADGSDEPRRDANRITLEEISAASHPDAYRLVQSLRPRWLIRRGPMSIADPTAGSLIVYLDGSRYGGAESLRQLSTTHLAELEYLDGAEASSRFGLGHGGGAILVTTRLR